MKKKSGRQSLQKSINTFNESELHNGELDKELILYSYPQNVDIVISSYPEGMSIEYGSESLADYIAKITKWHHDRNLIEGSTDKDQTLKLMQELGELSDSVCKGKNVADDIGDMIVVLINITERNNLSLLDCLKTAWNDIKDRKGKMINGVFVKESDL